MWENPRAWWVTNLGEPEAALRLGSAVDAPPGARQARVEVCAIGLNHADLLVCSGRYQERPPLPFVPGFEASGRIVEVGSGADLEPGQRVVVVPELPAGALAETLTVDSSQLYPVPDEMPFEVAAVLHVAYQTAHFALHHRGGVRPGESVLISGAAGGVGAAALQLGRLAGVRCIALATGATRAAACRQLGADEVLDLAEIGAPHDADDPLVERIRELTGGRGADVVIDIVGGSLGERLRRCVGFEGRMVVVGFSGGRIGSFPANHVLLRNYSVVGLYLSRYRRENPDLLASVHSELVAPWSRGALEPPVQRVMRFEEAPASLALLARREVVGRVVLRTRSNREPSRCPSTERWT